MTNVERALMGRRVVGKDQRIEARERFWRMYERMSARIAYAAELEDGTVARVYVTSTGKPSVIGFAGTAGKPAVHYSVKTVEEGKVYADRLIEGRKAHAVRIAKGRAERNDFRTTLEVGNILDASWGYDQTNVDFYEVIEVSPDRRYVTIRPVGQKTVTDGWEQGSCWPQPGVYTGEPTRHRVQPGNSVKVRDWGVYADLWRGQLRHWTSYA